jgi:dihydrofolate reductase
MLVFGSARMSESLMRAGLIDEYRIGVVPRVLGVGRMLFPLDDEGVAMKLRLLRSDTTKTGCTILRYAPRER